MINADTFIRESLEIEGILRAPREAEYAEFNRFMALRGVTVPDLETFVKVYEPGAELRLHPGQSVRIGSHVPPIGGPKVLAELEALVEIANQRRHEDLSAFLTHKAYESLHPFTDCNGRSGRMLWAWMMGPYGWIKRRFLHTWYYQSLQYGRLNLLESF